MSLPPPRQPDHAIDPIFVARHSPRAFTGEALPESELLRMIEAARWSPSAYNSQPWRFLYALRGDANWDTFFGLLVPGNQKWVSGTGAILFLVSNGLMKVGDELTEEQRPREAPNGRRPITDFLIAGPFPQSDR